MAPVGARADIAEVQLEAVEELAIVMRRAYLRSINIAGGDEGSPWTCADPRIRAEYRELAAEWLAQMWQERPCDRA